MMTLLSRKSGVYATCLLVLGLWHVLRIAFLIFTLGILHVKGVPKSEAAYRMLPVLCLGGTFWKAASPLAVPLGSPL